MNDTHDPVYTPSPKTRAILEKAMEHIDSVPYAVSARWLFYRLLQDGIYTNKEAYKNKFLAAISKARKAFYNGWKPDTLTDETRKPIYRGTGHNSVTEWMEALKRGGFCCNLNLWARQKNYVEIWFEAAAMQQQFEHYTENITLRPFRGDPSIDYKGQIADYLKMKAQIYRRPIVILYFGDLDPKGVQIPESAMADIRKWSGTKIEFVRCGLNPGQPEQFNIPENFEKPGTYQWEALDDAAAEHLITEAIKPWVDQAAFDEVRAVAHRVEEAFLAHIRQFSLEVQP